MRSWSGGGRGAVVCGLAAGASLRLISCACLLLAVGLSAAPLSAEMAAAAPQPAAIAVHARLASASLPSVDSAPPPRALHGGGVSAAEAADFDYDALPGRLADPGLRRLWQDGLQLERAERLLESAQRYELIVGAVPEQSFTYWRIARNYWRHGESLPTDARLERVHYFERSEAWAGRGISIDPDCAPCMLWKFVAMGRQATTKGLLTAAGDVREMDRLLRRGIELEPSHRDAPGNATLGNLYYAGAVFYRVIPEWFWLRWFIGMRGDKERSVEYARRAVEIAAVRIDYRVELGAALLCMGTDRGKADAISEGTTVLRAVEGIPDYLSTDHLDRAHARILIEAPGKACGYSRDGFIDLEGILEESQVRR